MTDVTQVVCLVLIDDAGFILATQRPEGKKLALHWEFPGGKVEPGESPQEALRREILEELHLELGDLQPISPSVHHYDFGGIELLPFISRCVSRPEIRLEEHMGQIWLHPREYHSLTWAPADIPILEELRELGMNL